MLLLPALPLQATESELAAQYQALRPQLDNSSFKRPLVLKAGNTANGLQGEVFAVVDHPVHLISAALSDPGRWCDALTLHVNNRACSVSGPAASPVLTLSVVRKFDLPLDSAFRLPFDFQLVNASAQHLEVHMGAKAGPMGTSNYRIAFEAIGVGPARSFLHFAYAYDENMLARAATQAYLTTIGHKKVGFTVVGQGPDGKPEYIKGTQGVMERNAMRYFLSVEAYLAAGDMPGRWNAWYAAMEKYPLQLYEFDRATYLSLKTADARRPGAAP